MIFKSKNKEKDKKEMSFIGHLEELRWRLVKSSIAIIIIAIFGFIFIDDIFDEVILPLRSKNFITYRVFNDIGYWFGMNREMFSDLIFDVKNIEMMGQFTTHISIALMGGLIIAFPYIFYQVWQFVKPGLRQGEEEGAKNVVLYSTLLMIIGLLFGYFVVSPLSIHFFGNYVVSETIGNEIRLGSYISMVVKTTFFTGLLFQLPIVVYILSKIGIVSAELLRRYRKHSAVAILIIAAIITPPDFVTQILVGIPVFFLYEVGIIVSKRVEKVRGY